MRVLYSAMVCLDDMSMSIVALLLIVPWMVRWMVVVEFDGKCVLWEAILWCQVGWNLHVPFAGR